jgi:hypothetical protein
MLLRCSAPKYWSNYPGALHLAGFTYLIFTTNILPGNCRAIGQQNRLPTRSVKKKPTFFHFA